MAQPVPKKIQKTNPQICNKEFNTLLIDGSNILELSSLGDKTISSNGKQTGGIFQFLLQIKILLQKGNFRYVYVFWDGENSGQYRYNLYPLYKANRDKNFEDETLSDYMKEVNRKVKNMTNYFRKKQDPVKIAERKKQKEIFYWQREVIMSCLEELCIRQCIYDKIEADDFISYYVTHKKPNERIVIVSNDRDLTQLISEQVIIYVQTMKDFITLKNHTDVMGYNYKNVVVKKILCGDDSDNIKGIKGVGEKTLLTNFGQLKKREVSLEEIINEAKILNETRVKNKKKPLKWAENIVNSITDGVQGHKIYEINYNIIDLRNPECPMMSKDAKDIIESMMYAPMDTEGRSIQNLYRILDENGVDELRDPSKFGIFFTEFMYIIDKEKKNSSY